DVLEPPGDQRLGVVRQRWQRCLFQLAVVDAERTARADIQPSAARALRGPRPARPVAPSSSSRSCTAWAILPTTRESGIRPYNT
ncbi:MAG: hypothetical protein R6X32_15795, partial [Chloroflexota bacterium]